MSDRLLTATATDGSTLFAVVAAGTREPDPQVSDRRLSAFLRPFRDEASARVALRNAGGTLEKEGSK